MTSSAAATLPPGTPPPAIESVEAVRAAARAPWANCLPPPLEVWLEMAPDRFVDIVYLARAVACEMTAIHPSISCPIELACMMLALCGSDYVDGLPGLGPVGVFQLFFNSPAHAPLLRPEALGYRHGDSQEGAFGGPYRLWGRGVINMHERTCKMDLRAVEE